MTETSLPLDPAMPGPSASSASPATPDTPDTMSLPPEGPRTTALALLVAVQFTLILDSTIVGVALPSLGRDLGFSPQNLSWVTNAYVLLFGGFLLLGGRLADRVGRRRLFVGALLVFGAASGCAGLADSPGLLVAARAVQGLAAAFAAPAALSLLMTVFPNMTDRQKVQRAKALGVYGAVSGAGGAVGMMLGGVLTYSLGWRAVFYVTVPIALGAASLAPRLLPPGHTAGRGQGFDLPGAVAVTGGLALLVYVLVSGGRAGWASPRTLTLAAVALALLAGFIWIESHSRLPLVPLGIWRHRQLRAANAVGSLVPMAMVPTIFFLTLYMQLVRGFSPLVSGFALAPLTLSIMLSATNARRLMGRWGVRRTLLLGTLLVAAGTFWASRIDGGNYFVEQLGPEIVAGLGGGTVWVTATATATASASEQEAGLASGLINTANQVGAALGLAVLATVASSFSGSAGDAGGVGHVPSGSALLHGYRAALTGCSVVGVLAAIAVLTLLPGGATPAARPAGRAGADLPESTAGSSRVQGLNR